LSGLAEQSEVEGFAEAAHEVPIGLVCSGGCRSS
jgi:hypothetical protein